MGTFWEARIGCMIAAGGVVWAVQLATSEFRGLLEMKLPHQPVEVCALGILIWLHAKWRGSLAA
jgi:hypothetical protein